MSTTSKKYLDENLKKEIWRIFAKGVLEAKSEKGIKEFLSNVIVPNELVLLEKRLGIIYLLKNGYKYKDISEVVDVSESTISFIKKNFKKSKKKEAKRKEIDKKYIYRAESDESLIDLLFKESKNSKYPAYRGKGRWKFLNK